MPIPTSGTATGLHPRGAQRRSLCRRQRGRGVVAARSFALGAMHMPCKALCLLSERAKEDVVGRRRPQELALDGVPGAEHLDLAYVSKWKSPTQRDERRGAVGQFRHRLCALWIAGPRLGGDAAEKGRDLPELLPSEPSGLIEVVYAHVDEDPAAVSAEISARRLPVPLKARDHVDLAQLSRPDPLATFDNRGHKSQTVPNLQRHTCQAHEHPCLQRTDRRDPHRLLA